MTQRQAGSGGHQTSEQPPATSQRGHEASTPADIVPKRDSAADAARQRRVAATPVHPPAHLRPHCSARRWYLEQQRRGRPLHRAYTGDNILRHASTKAYKLYVTQRCSFCRAPYLGILIAQHPSDDETEIGLVCGQCHNIDTA